MKLLHLLERLYYYVRTICYLVVVGGLLLVVGYRIYQYSGVVLVVVAILTIAMLVGLISFLCRKFGGITNGNISDS